MGRPIQAPSPAATSSGEAATSGEAPIDDLGTNDFTEICGDILQRAFGHLKSPDKQIARVANTNVRTAKNWREKPVTMGCRVILTHPSSCLPTCRTIRPNLRRRSRR